MPRVDCSRRRGRARATLVRTPPYPDLESPKRFSVTLRRSSDSDYLTTRNRRSLFHAPARWATRIPSYNRAAFISQSTPRVGVIGYTRSSSLLGGRNLLARVPLRPGPSPVFLEPSDPFFHAGDTVKVKLRLDLLPYEQQVSTTADPAATGRRKGWTRGGCWTRAEKRQPAR